MAEESDSTLAARAFREEAPVPQADVAAVDAGGLRKRLEAELEGEVRFDPLSRALYSTDASVYQMEPLAVVLPRSRRDLQRVVEICAEFRCPLTVRGGGTSQAGQAVGSGLQVDTSKYLNRILEVDPVEGWVRVEPGVVLDELNAALRPHQLRFAPDVSTSNRATLGGMMANNSSGARSLIYGKTIDHVLEQEVVLADGSQVSLRPLSAGELEQRLSGNSLEARTFAAVRRLATLHAAEIEKRFPKLLRRVGGYNLDAFTRPEEPFNPCKLMVGSEGTLGVVTEARLRLLPLPRAKGLLVLHFRGLVEALEAVPEILRLDPAAVEVLDRFILDHTRQNPALERLRRFVRDDPGALLIVEFYEDSRGTLSRRLQEAQRRLESRSIGYYCHRAEEEEEQARIWALRKAALGLSMAMKGDAKSLSFVEDTAVSPEQLPEYIRRFLEIVRAHGTSAGVYAHASVGCLHVRPVVNLKTPEGIRQFEAIAGDIAELVLEYGGALSGEHGDGLVRSPFNRKMFGPVLYNAFRTLKRTFDPLGILNPGKIVDSPPLTAHLRYGTEYRTPDPPTFFDFSDYGGMGRAVEMCSGLGACRKKLQGTMCPSYMVTLEETHSTRGRANVLRLAMSGRLKEISLAEEQVLEALDLCLECRACKSECPVGVDMARFKSEFLAAYWQKQGIPWRARLLGNIDRLSAWNSALAPLSNWMAERSSFRFLAERFFHLDARRGLPRWKRTTLRRWFARRTPKSSPSSPPVILFADTFTNYLEPEIGQAAVELLEQGGLPVRLVRHGCCGRALISQGLLARAREYARHNTELLEPWVEQGGTVLFCEPSCLSALREDAPALLRGEMQRRAFRVAEACRLLEDFLEEALASGQLRLDFPTLPGPLLVHGHCHQKAMGLLDSTLALLSRVCSGAVVNLDAGCCGMAGSFGYLREHYEISRKIAERRLLPALRAAEPSALLLASGTSCRHQVRDWGSREALHPVQLLHKLVRGSVDGRGEGLF